MIRILLILSLLMFITGCQSGLEKRVADLEAKSAHCEDQKISSETATLIAHGYMFMDYDPRNYDVSTDEYPDTWRVQYTMKCRDCNGGNPYVLVNKRTGQVVQVFNAK